MVGLARLNHLHACMDEVLRDDTGDLVEAGVWRGGCTIFMQGMLIAEWRDQSTYLGRGFV